jgi:hypothetical protein
MWYFNTMENKIPIKIVVADGAVLVAVVPTELAGSLKLCQSPRQPLTAQLVKVAPKIGG